MKNLYAAAGALLLSSCAPRAALDLALPNDNRTPAGTRSADTLVVNLEATLATWRPDDGVDSTATVQVFRERTGAPRIPAPLIRATSGTEVIVTVRNSLDSTIVVHGLTGGATTNDTISIAPDSTRTVKYKAGAPGTYLYWGTTTDSPIDDRPWRDSQLTGAIVIDSAGAPRDTADRIFVITVLDLYPDDTVRNKRKEDVFELAINGRSWPHTERIDVPVGNTARWKWINGSYLPHPMHLHGFHFRVNGKGNANAYRAYATNAQPMVVTEVMLSGSTFDMEWTPTRAGSWLMHCHMLPHITPFPERSDSAQHDAHGTHDVAQHPLNAMSGLVLGITSTAAQPSTPITEPARRMRLLAQQGPAKDSQPRAQSFVLQRGDDPRSDSTEVPGAPIVLTRGERAMITVVNRLTRPTTVHWHGMELESVYDGVSGWSRTGSNVAPLVAPGDSFAVEIAPPRAGTFIYHTHIDEGPQLPSGMYGPLLVLEPGQRYDAERDLVFIGGGAITPDSGLKLALNGRRQLAPRDVKRGTTYRLRLINIHGEDIMSFRLVAGSTPLTWRAIAKDGADLPSALRVDGPAELKYIGVGETYDFAWTPTRVGEAALELRLGKTTLRQVFRVR